MYDVDYKQLIQEGKRYLKFELNYNKLTAVEKLAVLLSSIAIVAVVGVIGAFVLSYLGSTLAMAIAESTGSVWTGNLIVAAIFLMALLVIVLLRKTLIIDPITRFITKLFLAPDENE